MSRRCLAPLLVLLALAACGGADVTPPGDDKPDVCEADRARAAVEVQDRKILGVADAYPADATLAAREDELVGSMAARRAVAWAIVARVLAPAPLAEADLPPEAGTPAVPRFRTFYGKDDVQRMFQKLYGDLGATGRRARAPFDPAALTAVPLWNANAASGLPSWPEERYQAYVAALDDRLALDGVGGIGRVGYGGAVTEHVLAGYARELACLTAASPPDAVGGEDTISARGTVEPCATRLFGPYEVGDGALIATVDGDADVDLVVRRGAPPTASDWDCQARSRDAHERCEVRGPGPIYVAVQGYDAAAAFTLTVTHDGGTPLSFASCLEAEVPRDGVVVKSAWRRANVGEPLPVYDTSATRLTSRLTGLADWGTGDGLADPGPDDIYTVQLAGGEVYRMPALHIMTKELRHWVWITLWWSPEPDGDFGADRPAAIAALPGPWRNYKMCVVVAYAEGDADPRGGQPGALGDALAAVHGGVGTPTWCSNPYLEEGPGNQASNCLGCHQHAGTRLLSEDIVTDEARFPERGRVQLRDNFPSDYLWSLVTGDDLVTMMRAEVNYWDSVDP